MNETVDSVLKHVRGSIWHWGSAPKYDDETRSPLLLGGRPVLVMSNNEYNRTHDKINALAFTSKYHGQKLPLFLDKLSYLMIDSWKDIPKDDLTTYLGIAPPEYMISVEEELMKHLAIVLKTKADVTIKQLSAYIDKVLEDAVNKTPVFSTDELSSYIISGINDKIKGHVRPNRLDAFTDVRATELKAQNPRQRKQDTIPKMGHIKRSDDQIILKPVASDTVRIPSATVTEPPKVSIPKSFYNHRHKSHLTQDEIQFIVDNFNNVEIREEIMSATNKTLASLNSIRHRYKKKNNLTSKYFYWSDEDKLFVLEHYKTNKEMLMEKYGLKKATLYGYYRQFLKEAGGK